MHTTGSPQRSNKEYKFVTESSNWFVWRKDWTGYGGLAKPSEPKQPVATKSLPLRCRLGLHKKQTYYWGDLSICTRCYRYKYAYQFVPKAVLDTIRQVRKLNP